MKTIRTAVLHYTAPPVVGGVEAVISAHAEIFHRSGFPMKVIAGRGDASYLPSGVDLVLVPEIDSQNPEIMEASEILEQGRVPDQFPFLRDRLKELLLEHLLDVDVLIVHNVFTKHFNLPLTAALYPLMDEGGISRCLAWSHDFSWTSANSRRKVFSGYPWDLLRSTHPRMHYVTIAAKRRNELAGLLEIPEESISVVYNGVNPYMWFGLSEEGWSLIKRLDLLSGDLLLLMPVRVTQAKNIEFAQRVIAALKLTGYQPRLVITGPPDPHDPNSLEYFQSLLDLRDALHLHDEVRFVYENGPDVEKPYMISQQIVSELMRVCDMMFIPSHREGFGMPVLEAGLIGMPVISSENVPAAVEIGSENIIIYNAGATPEDVAKIIDRSLDGSKTQQFRRNVRQQYTWEQIFRKQIIPLLYGEP